MWYGPERPKWLGPLSFEYPAYLRGELPGDYGWDPLGLARDPAKLDRYFELELLHARWAMLAALGALLPGGYPVGRWVGWQQGNAWCVQLLGAGTPLQGCRQLMLLDEQVTSDFVPCLLQRRCSWQGRPIS